MNSDAHSGRSGTPVSIQQDLFDGSWIIVEMGPVEEPPGRTLFGRDWEWRTAGDGMTTAVGCLKSIGACRWAADDDDDGTGPDRTWPLKHDRLHVCKCRQIKENECGCEYGSFLAIGNARYLQYIDVPTPRVVLIALWSLSTSCEYPEDCVGVAVPAASDNLPLVGVLLRAARMDFRTRGAMLTRCSCHPSRSTPNEFPRPRTSTTQCMSVTSLECR